MTYIPDCRTDENYNQKYLNEASKNELIGYDYCAEGVVDNFFENIDTFTDSGSYIYHYLNKEVPETEQETYEFEWGIIDKKSEVRQVKTILDWIRSKMLEWIEMERDEVIVSMIEGMEQEEYESIKNRVDNEEK